MKIIYFIVDIKTLIIKKFSMFFNIQFSQPVLNDYSCAIDLGCYHEKDESKLPNPRLCALEFPSMRIFTQESLEKL